MEICFYCSDIWSAYDAGAIGSEVGDPAAFELELKAALKSHDKSKDRAPGQHFIILTDDVIKKSKATCGVGYATKDTGDYVLREFRGQVKAFLKRQYALEPNFFASVVYTRDAYLRDPQVIESGEQPPVEATHVLVAAIVNAEGVPNPAPRSPSTLVACLAGKNNEAEAWSLDEVKQMAKASDEYSEMFSVVAS